MLRAAMIGAAVSVIALAVVAGVLPDPAVLLLHENPDTTPQVFDPLSLPRKYSESLDYISRGDAAKVKMLQRDLSWANIPAELRNVAEAFLSSNYVLAQLSPEIQVELENSRTMLAQFRWEEAEQSLTAAAQKLLRANSERQEAERHAKATARLLQVDRLGKESALWKANEEVESKLLRLGNLLSLISERHDSLKVESEVLRSLGLNLRPTAITLSVEPGTAFVGDRITFQGSLIAEEEPLAGRKVTILLNGSPTSEVLTDDDGTYQGQMVLPYHYVSEMALQALYYPQGEDIGLYLGSSSPKVTIKVPYYQTRLTLQVPGNAYPGRKLRLRGSLDYGDSPVPQGRSLLVYWDGELAAEQTVATAFSLELPVAAETSLGKHRVTAYMSWQGRYAAALASAEVVVVKAVPVIDMDAPGIVLLPFALHVQGRVYSTLGPLQDASLRIALGNWEATVRSGEDGSFSARLGTGMSLTLVGSQKLRVSVTPSEPRHRAGSQATALLVINPVIIGGLALVLALPVFFATRRPRWRQLWAPAAPRPQPAPALVRKESPPPRAEPAEARGTPGDILIALYRGVLRLVQRLTAVVLRPSHTLREFAQECAPRLGPLASYFQEFTLMIERLLYSRHGPSQADAAHGRELSQRLEEGAKGEGA